LVTSSVHLPAGLSPHNCTVLKRHLLKPWSLRSRGLFGNSLVRVPIGDVSHNSISPRVCVRSDTTASTCAKYHENKRHSKRQNL
jgi:hypothetical protein